MRTRTMKRVILNDKIVVNPLNEKSNRSSRFLFSILSDCTQEEVQMAKELSGNPTPHLVSAGGGAEVIM